MKEFKAVVGSIYYQDSIYREKPNIQILASSAEAIKQEAAAIHRTKLDDVSIVLKLDAITEEILKTIVQSEAGQKISREYQKSLENSYKLDSNHGIPTKDRKPKPFNSSIISTADI